MTGAVLGIDIEMEVSSGRAEESSMGMEVDEVNDMEVNTRGIISEEDPPDAGRDKDPEIELVCIRVFRSAKDWQPLSEIELGLESCGGLNLARLQEELGGPIQVSCSIH